MSAGIAIAILFLVFFVTILIGVPFAWSLCLSCMAGILSMGGNVPISFFAQRMYADGEKYTLLAIFFFLLAGAIMQYGGIAKRLVDCAKAWFGQFTGGLSIVVLVACMFFAALSGSSIATTAAIGAMLFPELVEAGYPEGYAAALPVAGGTLGIVIPPSIVFVVYGTTVNTSVSKLLISGIIPGVITGMAMCIYAYFYAKTHNLPKSDNFNLKHALKSTKDSFWALLMPIVVLGGIYSGIFTPTESAGIAVVYGLIVSFFYHELSFKKLTSIMLDSVKGTANILLLIMAAGMFGWVLTTNNVPNMLTAFMTQFIHNKFTFLILLNVLLIILGMLMDSGAIILIVAPLIYPMAMSFGIDPVQLGCIMVFNLAVGQATPPFGNCLFAGSAAMNVDVMALAKKTAPFVAIEFGCVLLTSFIPDISLCLVRLMS